MLKFIFGLPCSGKTTTCFQKIKQITDDGGQAILMVPEQFSFESEREALRVLGDNFPLNTTVLSFTRLYDEVSREIGGICARELTDADKVIFMNKALILSRDDLKLWGKYVHSVTFAKTMLDTISEFKINAIKTHDIEKAIALTDRISLKNKLSDLKVIYKNYDLLVSERFFDPSDKLNKLYENLSKYKFFAGKTVFLDSFKGFTGGQYKILERIISQANDVYVSFTNDIENAAEYNVFSNIRLAVEKIEKIAEKFSKKQDNSLIMNNSFYNSNDLKLVEKLISGKQIEKIETCENVTVCTANTVFDEAEFCARTIRKLVRTENYRFRDFVIIARDAEKYANAVEYACKKNGVSLFFDRRLPLSALPFSKITDYAINALDFSSENILAFLKSANSILTTDEISTLENYTYLWNISGDLWLKEWDMHPKGFVTDQLDTEDIETLQLINSLRVKSITPLFSFKKQFNGNALNMSKAVINLFEECNLKSALGNIYNFLDSESDVLSPQILKQGYDAFLKILDSLVVCYGESNILKSDYCEALSLAVSLESIGLPPQTLDQVAFGEADRIRPSRPKITFILGANQGVFPKVCENSGIFAINERKKLIELGLEISDNSIFNSIEENYLVYCNLCCATDKLFISYSKTSLKGEKLEASAFVNTLVENLNPVTAFEPQDISIENIPETYESAFSEFCKRINVPSQTAIFNLALSDSVKKQKVEALIENFNKKDKYISKENAKRLYGKDIYMSATRIDTFNRCKFSYFCKYGLKAQKLQPADFDVLQRGTIVHYVLERFITEFKENIKDITRPEIDRLTEFYVNEYLECVSGYNSVKNARHEFIVSKIIRALKEVVYRISDEFAQSEFVPVACELKIGKDGIPLNFDYSDGKILINGSIDRVDRYNGYVRIIDYKTGSKSFKLPDILFGLNLQMLLYLYSIVKNDNSLPAGILYMPSKRDLNDEGMAMNGLVLQDLAVVEAMEKQNQGEFVPQLKANADGSFSKTSQSFANKEEFDLIFSHIERLMARIGNDITSGDISVNPIDGRESPACKYCDFKTVCGIENDGIFKVPSMNNSKVFETLKEETENGI